MKAMGDENNLTLVMSITAGENIEYISFMISRSEQKYEVLEQNSFPAVVTEDLISSFGFTKNEGTVTGVKINGSTKSPSSGTVDIGNVVTSIKINNSTKNPSNGVVNLGTVITEHQSLKTINGQSILGSGDITISGGGEEQIEEPYVEEVNGTKFIVFDDVDTDGGHINTPMMPDVTYVCTETVGGVVIYNIQLPTGNIGKYTLHFVTGEEGGYIDLNSDIPFYAPNGALNTDLEPYGIYELSIVVTKLIYNGETMWFYKVVLTAFNINIYG
jgi:hypothetical protein